MRKAIHKALMASALVAMGVPSVFAASPEPEIMGDAASGMRLFLANCMICHGAGGKGDGPYASKLPDKPAVFASPTFAESHTDESIYSVISKGGAAHRLSPYMRAWGFRLEQQQIADLTAYVSAIANGTSVDMGIPPSGKPGEKMYFDYCSACHGPGGKGDGALAYTLRGSKPKDLTSQEVSQLPTQVLFRAIKVGLDKNNIPLDASMPSWGRFLSDEQILAIVEYIRSLSAQK
ncbi:MAG: c-type cytochrome [Gammaproteobacteria bacterium]|nr:c-type cytochrome [Gammaproteobacteria bacterium]